MRGNAIMVLLDIGRSSVDQSDHLLALQILAALFVDF